MPLHLIEASLALHCVTIRNLRLYLVYTEGLTL